jgi:hypothetical protein
MREKDRGKFCTWVYLKHIRYQMMLTNYQDRDRHDLARASFFRHSARSENAGSTERQRECE